MECEAGGAVSNRTCTPGSTVRIIPAGTVTSPVTMYGLPGAVHVVFPVSVPETKVGPARAVGMAPGGRQTRMMRQKTARAGAEMRTPIIPSVPYLSSLVQR